MTPPPHLLEMNGITKDFPGIRALENVNLCLDSGEVLGLSGENGAGKSTLMNILGGVYPYCDFEGRILIDGKKAIFKSVRDSQLAGISVIHQELSLIPQLTVMENIFLSREPVHGAFGFIDMEEMFLRTQTLMRELSLPVNPDTPVSRLSIGQQQMIEIARAISVSGRIVVMDEPTSALSDNEISRLFDFIRLISAKGMAVIYISHKLDEVSAITTRLEILRDGRTVGGGLTREMTHNRIIELMVGRELEHMYPAGVRNRTASLPIALSVSNLTATDKNNPDKISVNNVSFELRQGEILGIAGLMGAGRTELAEALFGVSGGEISGTISIFGKTVVMNSPDDAISNGIGFVTEDRKLNGIIYGMSLKKNISLPSVNRLSGYFIVNEQREETITADYISRLHIKANSMEVNAETLSGGNQQKAIIAKWLALKPSVLIMDEPTRGIDVAAKSEIHALIRQLAYEGLGVLLISSELPEILGICDRILVMKSNAVAGELEHKNASQEKIMRLATDNFSQAAY